MPASTTNSPPSLSSTISLNCQRCSQPLQLDESLSDEALASVASSSSMEGALTVSNYDVISSLVANKAPPSSTQVKVGKAASQHTPLRHVKDPELREAVLQHHREQHSTDPTASSSSRTLSSTSAPNSLTARLSLHARLFDLVSSFVPAALPSEAPSSTSSYPSGGENGGGQGSRRGESARQLSLGIDHPLCLDCSDYCLEVIRRQVEEIRKERDSLTLFNRVLEGDADDSTLSDGGEERSSRGKASGSRQAELEVERMEAEITELQGAVQRATASLYRSERTRKELEEELRQLELEESELEAEETEFWAAHSKLLSETSALESTKSSLLRSLQVAESTLARLNSTNVFYDAFCIGHEGGGSYPSSGGSSSRKRASGGTGLATINGLRFGKMSSSSSSGGPITVEWNEVNAAWGQVALLVEVLRARIGGMLEGESGRGTFSNTGRRGREFVGWRVRPKGSTSAMEKISPAAQHVGPPASSSPTSSQIEDVYELYHPGPWAGVTRMLHSRRFDAAMIGILDCTSQLFQWAEKITSRHSSSTWPGGEAPRMVHTINGEKIGDISIRLAGAFFASEETWSRATKYLLVDLQVLMHWATRNETVPVPAPSQI